MTKLYTFLTASSILLLFSCKTASKSYDKGDYTEAIELGVKKLQKNPDDYELRTLIQRSYDYAVKQHEEEIRNLNQLRSEERYERIYRQYLSLQHLYKTIQQYPAAMQQVKATDYASYVTTYREKTADVHIARADKWAEEGTKQAYREAFRELNRALHYRDDFELRRRRDEAYEMAVTNVIISPVQNLGGYNYASHNVMQNFQRDIIRTLTFNMNNDFVRFFNEFDARSQNVHADQVLDLNLSRITIGQPNENRSSREVSKEVVVKETVYRPDSVVKQYATVKANIVTTQRTLISQGDLFITLRDTRGQIIWNDRFTGEHRFTDEAVSYTGDERALSTSDKNSLKNYSQPPTEDRIMDELFRQIQTDLMQRLRGYYSRHF